MWSNFTPSCMVHLDLKLTRVECHPEKILVYFWGQYCNAYELDYHILQAEIQTAAKTKADVAVDELCFVEDTYRGEWYRGRVIRKEEESYDVFLIDVGMVLTVDAGHVASASKKLFQLPPKVVCGIFANIIPIRRKWSSMAVKYFASLASTQIKGYVEDVLMNQIVLEVPSVNQKLLKLGLAKILDGSTFHFLLEMSEDLPRYLGCENAKMQSMNKQCWRPMLDKAVIRSLSFKHIVDVFSLNLQTNVTESVRITCASGLHNFYCQLKKMTSELEAMTKDMHDYYENKEKELNDEHINNSGALCAAKCRDGKWYRAVVKQLLTSGHVEIWLMDYGSIAVVLPHHIKQLMPDFFMMPVMSFPCAVTDLEKQTKHWINLQIEIFKQSLFEEELNILIDSYSCIEHLYYVTLCNPQNINVHRLPETLSGMNWKIKCAPDEKASKDVSRQFGKSSGKLASNSVHYSLRSAEMKVNASYVGFVEYVINPSDFWIRTSEYSHDFECLMNSISDYYSEIGVSEELIQKPAPGLFCCAMYSGDQRYYRAVITDVFDGYLKVFFIDYGNTEIVDVTAVKSLLPVYTHLPPLAMNCSIARIFPTEGVWTKDATNFFKKAVFNKELSIEVVSKEGGRYIIDVRDKECMEQPAVSTLMLKSGYADFWIVKADNLPKQNCKLKHSGNKAIRFTKSRNRTYIVKNSKLKNTCSVSVSPNKLSTLYFPTLPPIMSTRTEKSLLVSPFRQQVFKLGSVFDVRVSHIKSPAEFWCQLQSKSDELELLMREIQLYYSIPREAFQPEDTGCVAKYSKDGQWYRATVIKRNIPKEVTVLFVDYGIQQRTTLKNLCAINPKFVHLEEQAFSCTINGIIQSVNQDPTVWDQVSYNTFKQFIDKTLTSDLTLKCTLFAKALKNGKDLCNVVDLYTPYTNLCQLFLNMGLATNVKSPFSFSSSIQLYTFYYSDHDIRIGSEEKVYVTHASGLSEFYCQFEKNTLVVHKLMTDITHICKQMQGQKWNFNKTCMCLAKYFGDGLWYRALAYSVQSPAHFKVFFVDYGNTEIVDKNDVIPIPLEALELTSIPMQAVKCCLYLPLQKVPDDFTLFKETVMEKQLKAFVVAKKSDGQLVLDLYDGNVKISDEITQQLYGSGVRCLDDTQWRSRNSSSPTNIVTSSKQIREHSVKETKGSISSDLNADLWFKGRKNKDQNGAFKNIKVPCNRGGKNTTCLQLKKFVPGYNFHQTNLGKACNTRNTGKAVHPDKTRFCVWKTKMIPHIIDRREMTTPTVFNSPVQNIAAVPNAKDSIEIICRSKKKTARQFPQDFTKLFGRFNSGIWKIDAASVSEKHKVFHASDAVIILKGFLFDLDGWMNKMACADVKIASAKHVSLKSLLPGESARQCLSALNLIACGSIQPAKEYSGFASSVIDPSEFYIQLDDTFETMITLSSFLAELPENLQTLSLNSLKVGVAYLIKCTSSNHWCRIEICAVSQQFVLARAVDYGHYIFIQPSDFSRICALPQELADLPRLTNHCILNGVVPAKGDFWTDEAIVFFQKSLNKQNLTVIFRQYFAHLVWEVDVVINNKSVAGDLVAAGHAAFLKEIVNSSTEDTLSSLEVSRILAGPISNRHIINMVSCSPSRRKPIDE